MNWKEDGSLHSETPTGRCEESVYRVNADCCRVPRPRPLVVAGGVLVLPGLCHELAEGRPQDLEEFGSEPY